MKKFFLSLLCLLVMVTAAHAGQFGGVAFSIFSASSGAVKTTVPQKVFGYKTKSVHVNGVTLTSNAAAQTFKNMSGTLIAECAPTTNGPWSQCATIAGTHVSATSNDYLTWEDAVAYIRLKWTASTTGQKIKAWLNWVEY